MRNALKVKTYKVSSKVIETEAVFTQTEMNNEWNINFLQNSPLDI